MEFGEDRYATCEFDRQAFHEALSQAIGTNHVLTDAASIAPYATDWTGAFRCSSSTVVRPGSTAEVATVVKVCRRFGVAITPQGGNTGIAGGSIPLGRRPEIVLALDRMRTIRKIDPLARTATVDAGVVLATLQDAVSEHDLIFPLMFGARGSCTIGGNLATNAGGSNVLRHGNTRDLCLGIEAVMADGSIVDNLTGLRKDNTGYDLRHLLIGSEGTLGIITGAVLELHPRPIVVATAFLALKDLGAALDVLNHLQAGSGGLVEAFEYMPADVVALVCGHRPDVRQPLAAEADTGILVELASTRKSDGTVLPDGSVSLQNDLMAMLAELMDNGAVEDAVVASSERQRNDLWTLRESVLESLQALGAIYIFDAALPLARIDAFVDEMERTARSLGFRPLVIGHLGDGNLHYAVAAEDGKKWSDLPLDALQEFTLSLLQRLSGSFSAEHGIGQEKRRIMKRWKQASQLSAMQKIKSALDPYNILNPGKLLP